MPDLKFSFMTLEEVLDGFADHHQGVCRQKGRVEIRNGDHTCVLISKEELDSLEQALEILSNTSDVQKMARTIAALTHVVAQGPLVAVGSAAESH